MLKRTLTLLLLPLLLGGCAATITNLTPMQQTRTANNLYMVEAAFDTHEQALRWDSIKPQIIVGQESYAMRPTQLMTNRWEGFIPVAPGTTYIQYHYKFDYSVNTFGHPPQPNSARSPLYTLKIVEP